jgi:hypothetical protein
MDYRRVIQSEKGCQLMQDGVDNFLYQHGIPTDRYFLRTISLGKFVQGQVTGPLRSALIRTGFGRVLQSCPVDSHVML